MHTFDETASSSSALLPYTQCLADTYDAVACEWQFHECEPEAEAISSCLDTQVCLTQCAETANGCDCSHACIGGDYGWSCVEDNGGFTCACSQEGKATFECSEQVTGTCDTVLYASCCLNGPQG